MNGQERSRLDVIESKIDLANQRLELMVKTLDDHEARIRSVERWKLSLPVSIILILASLGAALLGRGGL